MLYEKLVECLQNCTEGFHTRINLIWMSWFSEKNFAERLQKIRQNIVLSVAINLYDDVHAQNSVSKISRNMKLGTVAISPKDPYTGQITPELITHELRAAFNQDFTPLLIIQGIEEQLFSQLASLGYSGNKPEGILFGVYGAWLEFFQQQFPEETIDPSTWLVLSPEKNIPCDVNWPTVRKNIFKTLVKEQFFINLSPDLPLQDIPFDRNYLWEFKYWAVQLADETSLTQFLGQTPEVTLKKLKTLHDVLPSNHHFFESLLTKHLLKLIDTHLDMILNQYLNSCCNLSMVRWILTVMSLVSHEKLLEFINLPLPRLEHKTLLLAVVNHGNLNCIDNFLDFINTKLSRDEILRLYIHQDAIGNTVWSLAVKKPVAITLKLSLLALKHQLPIPELFISNSYDLNDDLRLLIQLKKNLSNVTSLLELAILTRQFAKRPPISLDLFIQEASKTFPNALFLLLSQMNPLSKKQRASILLQTDARKYNALMIAVQYQPDAVKPLLEAIAALEPESKQKIIEQVTCDRWNVLMIAACYQPKVIGLILEVFFSLKPEILQRSLQYTHRKYRGNNALMIALIQRPNAVMPLLKAISTLSNAGKATILMQTNEQQWNALMLASRHYPDAVGPLLEEIQQFSLTVKSTILLQNDHQECHPLNIVLNHQPQIIDVLLPHLHQLSQQIDVKPNLQSIPLEKFNSSEQLLSVLKLRGINDRPVTQPELVHLNRILSPANWYQIVRGQLLPCEFIKHKKVLVYQHIMSMNKEQQKDVIENIMHRVSTIGNFFSANQRFFDINYLTQLIAKLYTVQENTEDDDRKTLSRDDPTFLMFF